MKLIRSNTESIAGPTSPGRIGLTRYQMRKVTEYVENHLGSRINIEQLSSTIHLSRWHFSRVFSRATGLSPREYLMAARLQRAKTLVEISDWTICEISGACGFSDQSHLTRHFRKTVGATPVQWRQQFRQRSGRASSVPIGVESIALEGEE